MLSAQQVRAGRGLLGWSRRDLAIVSGISQGTIKAIEKGTTDARLSTLRKLAQTFHAHGVEFVATGPWTGAVIKNKGETSELTRGSRRSESISTTQNAVRAEQRLHNGDGNGDDVFDRWRGLQWLGPLIGLPKTKKV